MRWQNSRRHGDILVFRLLSPASRWQPGPGHGVRTAFRNDEREWTESLDLSALLRDALLARGQAAALARDGWVTLSDGLWLLPQILSYSRAEDGSVRTSSTIEVAHAGLLPQGVFEYQHSGGETTEQALTRGVRPVGAGRSGCVPGCAGR